jgi:hypothetical protein
MRSFRFPSISKSRSLIKYQDYYSLPGDDVGHAQVGLDGRQELSNWNLIALTCSAGGLQVVLSLIMSNGTVCNRIAFFLGFVIIDRTSPFSSQLAYRSQ